MGLCSKSLLAAIITSQLGACRSSQVRCANLVNVAFRDESCKVWPLPLHNGKPHSLRTLTPWSLRKKYCFEGSINYPSALLNYTISKRKIVTIYFSFTVPVGIQSTKIYL